MQRPGARKIALVGAGAAGVLALGLSVPAFAAAQEDPSASPSASTSAPADRGGADQGGKAREDREQRRAEQQDKLAEALAKELGIDQQKVADALEKVQKDFADDAKAERQAQLKERLDKAVEDGKLTREQADAIIAAAENGVLPGGQAGGWGPSGHRGGPGGPGPGR